MTKMYSPLEVATKVLEKTIELQKAEKNSAHVVEEGKKVAQGLVKKKSFGEESSESAEHEASESHEEEKQEHEEGSEESEESEAHEQSESPKEEKEEHEEGEEKPKKPNFFAKKPEMKKNEEIKRKSPILEFLEKREDELNKATKREQSSVKGVHIADPSTGKSKPQMAIGVGNDFVAIDEHQSKLKELKSMKKPNLPKSEDCDEVEEDEKELDKSAIRARKPTSLKVALRPKKQPVH